MSDRGLLGEQGVHTPDHETTEPDSFGFLVELVEKLGPNGVDALHNIALAERDLRNASTADPGLRHALERADSLMQVRFALEQLLKQAEIAVEDKVPNEILAHTLGGAAITEVKRK